jgi:hypothetical protein
VHRQRSARPEVKIPVVLTERQIERYSRQIIVVGGIAQERLLAARLAIAGEAADVESPIRYLINAGVGRFAFELPRDGAGERERLAKIARGIKADVLTYRDPPGSETDLELMIIGSDDAVALARSRLAQPDNRITVVVRLDNPPKIAIGPHSAPGPLLSAHNLLAPFTSRADSAGFVAMVAVMETLKLLTEEPAAAAKTIEFDGYQTVAASR